MVDHPNVSTITPAELAEYWTLNGASVGASVGALTFVHLKRVAGMTVDL